MVFLFPPPTGTYDVVIQKNKKEESNVCMAWSEGLTPSTYFWEAYSQAFIRMSHITDLNRVQR